VRGEVPEGNVRPGIAVEEASDADRAELREILTPYCAQFGLPLDEIAGGSFLRLTAKTTRPYGQLYAY
jgi:hypothetical protein